MKNRNVLNKILILLAAAALCFTEPAVAEDPFTGIFLPVEYSVGDTKIPVIEKVSKATRQAAKKAGQTLKIDKNMKGMTKKEKKVYKTIKAQKKTHPEGMEWTNMTSYAFKGGFFSLGFGCSAFCFKMSDIAFGTKKAAMHTNFKKIKVGDIVRLDNNTHSVIVMKVVANSLVVAEGNYGYSIHWGRIIPLSEVNETGTYVMTRY